MTTPVKLGRTTKIRQNFFVPSARSSFSIRVSSLSPWFNPSQLSLSSISAFVSILANRLSTAQPVLVLSVFVPTHYASSSSFYSSFHLVCCFDILSTTVSLFVLGPLGCAVYPMLTVGLTCTQLSRPFSSWVCHVSDARGGCNVYPRLAFLYSVRLVTSRPSSMFRSPSLSRFSNLSSPVILSCQSATVRLHSCQCLHGFAIGFLLFHHRIPVVIRWTFFGFMAPLWILGLLSRLRLRHLFCSLVFLFRRNLVFSQHRLFLSRHFFLRFRYPVSLQPNLLFRS